MSIPGIRPWIIIMAVLLMALVYFSVTGGGSTAFNFSVSG